VLAAFTATAADKPPADGQHQGGNRDWGFHRVTDAPALPRVLLVGDSIANGYHAEVATRLKGKANVDLFITGKHIAAPGYREDLAKAVANGPYAAIHFNESGLHAWVKGRVPDGQYGPLFAQAVAVLRAGSPQAKLIWASNTPATIDRKPGVPDEELNRIIAAMNTDARAVAVREKMAINDLGALMADKLDLAQGDRWHWTAKGKTVQAEAVTAAILPELGKNPAPPAEPPSATLPEAIK
jgi:hypothetical protein